MSTKSYLPSEKIPAGDIAPSLKGVWRFRVGPLSDIASSRINHQSLTIKKTSEGLKVFRHGQDEVILPLTDYSEFHYTRLGGAIRITDANWIAIESIRSLAMAHSLHEKEFWLHIFY